MAANNQKITVKLVLVAVAMFGFGFALVPLYDVFCDVTGLGGKTGGPYEAAAQQIIDESRWVTVQFSTTNNDGMPWVFKPNIEEIKVHPGQAVDVSFYVKNPAAREIIGQAVPSISPFEAAEFFHKTECFCFNQQLLKQNEEMDMPLRFIVDRDLPKHVKRLTLGYTLFDASNYKDESRIVTAMK